MEIRNGRIVKMTDHQKFEALLKDIGLSRKKLAKEIGMSYTSVTNQLAPAKKLPRWAKAMLYVNHRYQEKKEVCQEISHELIFLTEKSFLCRECNKIYEKD